MVKVVTIDLRLWSASGIGRYLRAITPSLIRSFPFCHFNLLGNQNELLKIQWPNNTSIYSFNAPIYSIAEQFQAKLKIPKDTDLLWWPHYNVPLFYRGRLVVTIYDAYHLRMSGTMGDFMKRLYARLFFGVVNCRAEKIFTISQFSKSEITALTNISSERIVVTHLGIDQEWFDVRPDKSLIARPYILFVGNVKPHKNLRRLISAFSLLTSAIPHDLVIVGKRDGFITGDREVERMAAALSDRVAFTGWISDYNLRQYVSNAEMMIFPSLYEGFGIPPLEAMACYCPVAASCIPVIQEICQNHVVYFDPTSVDSIHEVIRNQLIKTRDVIGPRKWSQQYTWDSCVEKTIAELSQIILTPKKFK